MWRMYCVCLLSVIVVLDLLGQSHVNRTLSSTESENSIESERSMCLYHYHTPVHHDHTNTHRLTSHPSFLCPA